MSSSRGGFQRPRDHAPPPRPALQDDSDRRAEITDFGKKEPRRISMHKLPFEERVSLLFHHGLPTADIAEQERVSRVDVEVAIRKMLGVIAERLKFQQDKSRAMIDRIYARHMEEVCRDVPWPTDEDHYRSRERLDVYGRLAQELQDELLNFQPMGKSDFKVPDDRP